MAPTPPPVTIGMPVYNGRRFLPRALATLLAQRFAEFELVISDNASTDGTADLCRDAAARDARVRWVRQDATVPAEENFGRVLALARAPRFMWAACDDLWEPDFLAATLAGLDAAPAAVLSFTGLDSVDEDDRPCRTYPRLADLPAGPVAPGPRLRAFLRQPEYLGKANLIYSLMPTDRLRAAGGLTPGTRYRWGVDMHAVFRLLARGEFVLDPRVLFHKRIVAAPGPRRPLAARAAGWVRGMRDRTEYAAGYLPLIARAPGLSAAARLGLGGTLAVAAARLAAHETLRALAPRRVHPIHL